MTPSTNPTTNATPNSGGKTAMVAPTPQSLQQSLIALAVLSTFVYLVYLFAGTGPTEGKAAVLLMVMILLVQFVNNAAQVGGWFAEHPGRPTSSTH